ncbi:MAG TPA: hypothetical protein DHW63_00200 [Hyphomonadaceae bacterium]|nr:hypothetical protein [Hyphomonadaceae bacterium]
MNQTPSCTFINLDRDGERRAHMERQCAQAGLRFERFSAANGADLPEILRPYFPFAGDGERSVLSRGEIGCYASHLSLCQLIVADAIAAPALILEDDVELPQDFVALLHALIAALPADWDIVRLSNDTKHVAKPTQALTGQHSLVRYSNIPGSTGASLLSRSGAEKFLRAEPRALPVDQDLRRAWHWNMNTFGVLPAPVRRDIFDVSTIDAMTNEDWREKGWRIAHIRRQRGLETFRRHGLGIREFGLAAWVSAEAINSISALVPKRRRPAFLAGAGTWLSKHGRHPNFL